eukprot:10322491-Lingulodinium_polyedra.AAC.1
MEAARQPKRRRARQALAVAPAGSQRELLCLCRFEDDSSCTPVRAGAAPLCSMSGRTLAHHVWAARRLRPRGRRTD